MRTGTFTQADSVSRLVSEGIYGPVFGLDRDRFFASDHLYRHDPRPACIDIDNPNNSRPPDAGAGCPEGTVRISRGAPTLPSQPVAIADDPVNPRVAIATETGGLHWVYTDPLRGEAIDFMRPSTPVMLNSSLSAATVMAAGPEAIAVADQRTTTVYDETGATLDTLETESAVVDALWNDGVLWLLTEDSVLRNGTVAGPGGQHLVVWQDHPWVIRGDTISDGEESFSHPGLTGPATAMGSSLIAITETGLARIEADGSVSDVWTGSAIDVDANTIGEVVVLHDTNLFTVFVDETTLPAERPLQVWASTFIERPRKPDDSVPCAELEVMLSRAEHNSVWLHDLPAAVALGVTPSHLDRAVECSLEDRLAPMLEQFDPGILFHHTPDECVGDPECHTDTLAEHLSRFSPSPTWASGLGTHTELEIDWIQTLLQTNAIDRYAFLGMGARPDIPHGTDLRGKDSWSVPLGQQSQIWHARVLDDLTASESDSGIAILPGDNIPAFNLGGCANLWLYECHPLGRGSGHEVSDEDIASLDLLLHRSLASVSGEGSHTWNFHLPDIALYDYTEDCTHSEGRWTGEACEAGRLQTWLLDVHQRFVLNERAAWTGPGGVSL